METLRLAPTMQEVNQEADFNQIRQVMSKPDLQLTFVGVSNLANAPWIDTAVYSDDSGIKYYLSIQDGRLAQIEPPFAAEVPAMDVKSIDEARPLAEQFAMENSPRLAQLTSDLTYE